MPQRSSNLSSSGQQASHEALPRIARTARRIILTAATFSLIGVSIPVEANADPFGQCAHWGSLDEKVASCAQAAKSTSYPRILQWVYRELARSHRERGEIQEAIVSYERSLTAEEREEVRREMEEMILRVPQGNRIHIRAAHGAR